MRQGSFASSCKPCAHIPKSPNGLAANSRSCIPVFSVLQVPLASFHAYFSPIEDPLEVGGLRVVIVEVHGQVLFQAS
jgi:hypothetical protein